MRQIEQCMRLIGCLEAASRAPRWRKGSAAEEGISSVDVDESGARHGDSEVKIIIILGRRRRRQRHQ